MGQPLPTKQERSILSVEKPRLFSAKEASDREVDRLMVFSDSLGVLLVGFSELGPSITRTY